jgi:hypothetical protein
VVNSTLNNLNMKRTYWVGGCFWWQNEWRLEGAYKDSFPDWAGVSMRYLIYKSNAWRNLLMLATLLH